MIVLFLHFKGEPFTQEEMEEMLSAAVDPEKNVILYKDFAALMTVEDYWTQLDFTTTGSFVWNYFSAQINDKSTPEKARFQTNVFGRITQP